LHVWQPQDAKFKGYINLTGYKIIADENANPGSYGFRIIHDKEPTHFFSMQDQYQVREWMKALMKATITRDYSGARRLCKTRSDASKTDAVPSFCNSPGRIVRRCADHVAERGSGNEPGPATALALGAACDAACESARQPQPTDRPRCVNPRAPFAPFVCLRTSIVTDPSHPL
jgi:hypothetical protein